jgi:carbonic anhydrase
MNEHKAEAIIITCIDHRIQADIEEWISRYFKEESFDRVALGGGIKDLDVILEQIDIAVRLHHIKKVILINHEDCGAYGHESTVKKHAEDLKTAKEYYLKTSHQERPHA